MDQYKIWVIIVKLTNHGLRYCYYFRIGLFINRDHCHLQFIWFQLLTLRTTPVCVFSATNIYEITNVTCSHCRRQAR